jgi:hypothetical protein
MVQVALDVLKKVRLLHKCTMEYLKAKNMSYCMCHIQAENTTRTKKQTEVEPKQKTIKLVLNKTAPKAQKGQFLHYQLSYNSLINLYNYLFFIFFSG